MSKETISLILGIIGLISLVLQWNIVILNPNLIYEPLRQIINNLIFQLPSLFGTIFELYVSFACIFVFFLSIIGIYMALKTRENLKKKIVIISLILNSINLMLSLFIAWLLVGLARGM